MRITPNHSRLRTVAVASCAIGSWLFVQSALLTYNSPSLLTILTTLSALIFCAVGLAFWLIANDQGAGIIFEPKGIVLNLGHSAAFVDWDNIAEVGIITQRNNLFALGSRKQIGLRLHDTERYLQSYESRLPAAQGPLAAALRGVRRAVSMERSPEYLPTPSELATLRSSTGYELMIPGAMINSSVEEFLELLEYYRSNRSQRHILRTDAAFS